MTDEQLGEYLHPITAPQDATDPDRRAYLVALLLRDIVNDVNLLLPFLNQPGGHLLFTRSQQQRLVAAIHKALPFLDALMYEFGWGMKQANDLDRLAAEEEAAKERLLQRIQNDLIYLGSDEVPDVWTLIGWLNELGGLPVALSRAGGLFLLAAGIINSGKSQSAIAIAEGLLRHIAGLNSPREIPTSVLSFHAIPDGHSLPDVLAGLRQNAREVDLDKLAQLGLSPQAISRMRLAMPKWLIPQFETELRPFLDLGLELVPLLTRLPQLALSNIELLMGADPEADYVQFMLDKAMERGDALTLDDWRRIIADTEDLTSVQKRIALRRLRLLERITDPSADLWDLCEPGVFTAISLGGKWIREQDMMPLMMGLMNALTQKSDRLGPFQRFFLLDEINRYLDHEVVVKNLMTTVRQIRHRGSSLMLCGQDLKALPDEMIALASLCMVFELRSPKIWAHIKERIAGFAGWRFEEIAALAKGYAVVAATASTDPRWRRRAQRMYFRPVLCEHGGHTKAVR
jgi:hypothetical protein